MVLNIKDFPDDLHTKAKMCALLQENTLREFIINSVQEAVKKENKNWIFLEDIEKQNRKRKEKKGEKGKA